MTSSFSGRAVARMLALLALLALLCGGAMGLRPAMAEAPAPSPTSSRSASASAAACPPQAPRLDASPAGIQRAVAIAKDRGLLWRIDKDGHASWLYGTLHIGKPEWRYPGPHVRGALMQSDTVALELDLLDRATRVALSAPGDAAVTARVLTPERKARLARHSASACLPDGALAALRPLLQVTALLLLASQADGLYGDYGSEVFLSGMARGRRMPVFGLETAADQLEALTGGTEAEQGQQIDEALDQLASGVARKQAHELAQAWADSDWHKLDSYKQWCDCAQTPTDRKLLARMLDDRNPGLADGIARLHDQGQRVFGAVGALHMVGPQGVPALLAARGFKVTRVVPSLESATAP